MINHEILASQLLVETEDHRRMMIDASQVLTVLKVNQSKTERAKDDNSREQSSSKGTNTVENNDNSDKNSSEESLRGNVSNRDHAGDNEKRDDSATDA